MLRELRTRRFISVAALAEKLGTTRQTIYNWEQGKARPNLDNLEKLVKFFGEEVLEHVKEGL